MSQRLAQGLVVNFPDNSTDSDPVNLTGGVQGSIVVPAALNGKTIQIKLDIPDSGYYRNTAAQAFHGVTLLASAKTLSTGNNVFTATELAAIAGAGPVRFVLNSAVSGSATKALLLWKD